MPTNDYAAYVQTSDGNIPLRDSDAHNRIDELDRTKAPAITESTSGESIQLSDSGDAPLTDIKLYGKSKQVKTTGAQLIDVTSGAQSMYKLPIPLEAGTYTVSFDTNVNTGGFRLSNTTDTSSNSVATTSIKSIGENRISLTLTIDFVANYINISSQGSSYVENIMLNKGGSALPYEPYTGGQPAPSPEYPQEIEIPGSDGNVEIESVGVQLLDLSKANTVTDTSVTLPTPNGLPGIPVTSGGNYTDADGQQWVCDEIDFKRGKYVQRVGKVVFDGDETWRSELPSSGNRYFIFEGFSVYSVSDNNADRAYSNYFRNIGYSEGDKGEMGITSVNSNIRIYIGQEMSQTITNTTQWNEYLSQKNTEGNPVYVLYQLQTPVETDLTTEQLTALKQLRTFQTTTNITTDTEPQVGMEVEYTADTKTWIDNAIKEVVKQAATLAKV